MWGDWERFQLLQKGEKVMNQQPTAHPDYESLQTVLNAIAQWVTKYRNARGISNDLANCGAEEVERIARDLRVHPKELAMIAKKGPNAADLLQKLLFALGVDAKGLEHDDPLVMRDLQRLCTTCTDKRQCQHDLANGVIAANFRDYCPNAFTLDALLKAKQ
ncbi:MAG: DUF6455 family protein [Pseudolabrys sp.]